MSTVPIARARFAQTEWEGEALPRAKEEAQVKYAGRQQMTYLIAQI